MSVAQFGRVCSLIVADNSGNGIELSALRIRFKVKKTDAQTPNKAEFRVYNITPETASKIQGEFTQVQFSAGYQQNSAIIFKGNIKQAFTGKEKGVNTYIDIVAGDGDKAYNFAVVNATIAPGATPADQVQTILRAMQKTDPGITAGNITGLGTIGLPRGKVLFGMARDHLRRIAETTQTTWSIQNMQLQFVPQSGLLDQNQAVVINSNTGMIDAPEQTNKGIKVKCLLNPMLKIGGKIQLNESDIIAERVQKVDSKPGKASKYKPAALSTDGIYRLLTVEHEGDTRDKPWYSNLVCLSVDSSAPKGQQIDVDEAGGW